jgi:peptidoglycan L-alanyl-D-glutamate endopeptidase CwlK
MRDVNLLHPELQVIVKKFLDACTKANLKVAITQTWRTEAEQEALYAKGRTDKTSKIVTNCKYPQSPHCWGVAFDFCRNDGKGAYYDSDGFFKKVGTIGKKCGLFWGGDFKSFVDKPHLELEKYLPNSSVKILQTKYSTPDKFKSSWYKQSN